MYMFLKRFFKNEVNYHSKQFKWNDHNKWISKECKKSLIWRSNVTYIKLQNMQKKHVCWYELKCEQETRWLGGTDVVVKLIPIFTKNKNPKLIRITISKNHCKIDMKICRKNKLSNQLIAIILSFYSLTKFCYLYPFQWLFISRIPIYGRIKK